jgi:hypothetical protein
MNRIETLFKLKQFPWRHSSAATLRYCLAEAEKSLLVRISTDDGLDRVMEHVNRSANIFLLGREIL